MKHRWMVCMFNKYKVGWESDEYQAIDQKVIQKHAQYTALSPCINMYHSPPASACISLHLPYLARQLQVPKPSRRCDHELGLHPRTAPRWTPSAYRPEDAALCCSMLFYAVLLRSFDSDIPNISHFWSKHIKTVNQAAVCNGLSFCYCFEV